MDWIIAAGLAGAAASAAATGATFKPGTWYDRLDKPGWTPPKLVFPIAWTILYIAMTYAAWRVATTLAAGEAGAQAGWGAAGLGFWAMQVTLNAMWSPLFFGERKPRGALACVAFLWLAILATLICFARVDWVAAALLAPYLVWASYAGALNLSILKRNSSEMWGRPE